MTPRRRLRIWTAAGGRCVCGVDVPLAWTVLDHEIQLWIGGPEDDSQIRPLCPACDRTKTDNDTAIRAHIKRLIAREDGTRRPRKPIPCRGFGPSRPLSNPNLTRGFDGKVVARKQGASGPLGDE